MKSEVIKTRVAKVWLAEDGILHVDNIADAEINLRDAIENTDAGRKILKNKKPPLLVDLSKIKSITREAREHYRNEGGLTLVTAQALLVGSPTSKVIGNFFLGLNKPDCPVKLFTSEKEAIEWLKGFI